MTLINFIVISCKIPSFNDQFFIRKEITWIVYVNTICIAIHFIMAIITYTTSEINDNMNLSIVLNNIPMTIYTLSIPLFSTVWVIREFKKNDVIIIDEINTQLIHNNLITTFPRKRQYILKIL